MTETLIWIGIGVAVVFLLWLAEPHHQRLIDAAHGKKDDSNWD